MHLIGGTPVTSGSRLSAAVLVEHALDHAPQGTARRSCVVPLDNLVGVRLERAEVGVTAKSEAACERAVIGKIQIEENEVHPVLEL